MMELEFSYQKSNNTILLLRKQPIQTKQRLQLLANAKIFHSTFGLLSPYFFTGGTGVGASNCFGWIRSCVSSKNALMNFPSGRKSTLTDSIEQY